MIAGEVCLSLKGGQNPHPNVTQNVTLGWGTLPVILSSKLTARSSEGKL